MSPFASLAKALSELPPELVAEVAKIVKAIVSSKDPKSAAARALEAAARKEAFDRIMKARSKR